MKLTQCKDAFRNIKKQFVSYLSVVMIAMLSVMAYLGIHFASRAIADNGTQFYREMHFRDVEVISTKLLTAGDIDAIRAVQGVQDVEGVLQTSGTLWNGTEHRGVDIVSLTDRINTPQLLEGRLPERPDECALEQPIMTALSLSVGDTIRVEGREGENADYLTAAEFTVTGVVFHPEHGCWELQVPGNRDVIVLPEVFDTKALDDCYMKALVTVEGTEGMNRFDKDYARTVQGTADALKALAEERTVLRDQEIQGRYQEEIDEGQARLDDAKAQLDDAQEQLDRNREKLSSGEQELDDAWQHIEEMSKILSDAEQELAAGKQELDSGTSELSAAEKELSKSLQQLNDGEAKLKASKQQLSAAESDLKQNKARLDDAEQQLRDGRKQLDDSKAELTSAKEELTTGFREIDDAKCRISNSIYQAVYDVIGKYADRITLYSGVDNVDPDASDLSATDFLLVKGVRIDLNHSMQENIVSLVHKLELSNEEWREVLGDRLTDNIVDLESFAADCIYQELASYESQYQTLADGARQWDSGHQTYLDGLEQYRSGEREYDQKKSEYDTAVARYNEGLAAYESGLAQYNKVRSELDEGWAKYRDGLAKYKEAKSKADDGQTLYDSKLQEYEEGLAALEDGERRYQEGQDSLESGRTALEEGEAAYEEHRAEYESGAAELEQAKTDFDALGICRWVVLDMEGNASYIVIRNGVNNVRNMGMTFSLVFVLVGALVIYTTVGRIMDEQRKLVGATKALGFYNREILFKYLFYGVSGTFIGMLLGLLMGYLFIQRIMLSTYGRYYVFGAGRSAFRLDMTLVVFAAGILLSSLTVWSACSNLMRSSAISLMQGKVPQISWKPKESRQKAGSLYRRLVWLNMLSDKQRVAVTVVSIAGCCSLLVAGFTMKYSVVKALNRQFDEIEHYALRVEFDPDASADPEQAIRALLADKNAQSLEIRYEQLAFSADGKLTNGELVCGDAAALSDYYTMHDIRTNEVLTAGDSGIWIHKRTAEKNGLSAGDEITLYDDAMNPYTTHVAGIFNIFAGRQMVLSRESYHEIFGEAATDNAFLIICDAADAKSLCEQIRAIDGVDAVSDINELRATYQSFASVLNLIALLFIAIAGLMAYFILLNSVNMYVNQKKPELTVMRINGFTVREVIGYVSYELILSTLAGIVLGWLSGSLLGYRVIRLLESPYLQFVRTIQWESWIWAALITLLFSAAISFLALRKIPRLKLTDAL